MKGETKLFIGIIVATLAVVVGGIFFFSQPSNPSKVDNSLLVRSDSQKISTPSATVTLVEFADYQCPACGAYYPLVKQVISEFHDAMIFVFRNFPLQQHQNAYLAAQVAEAAGKQGKYWEMHDLLFEHQKDWSGSTKAKDVFTQYAQSLQLNTSQFSKDLDKVKGTIDRDLQDGYALGVNSTPTFYLNGEKLNNPGSLTDFETLIKAAILKAPLNQKPTEAYHIHANFKVYLKGKVFDFSAAKYQSTEEKELSPNIHLHDGKADLIHIHKKGVVLGEFFKSLQMSLTHDCLIDDSQNKYCNDGTNSLKFYVNGEQNAQFEVYEPKDLDRILISYGSETGQVLKGQMDSVPDDACIYSEKCPERGKPPTEKCVGGLGTGCKD